MEIDIKSKYYIRKAYGGYSPCIEGNNKRGLLPFAGSVLPNCVGWATGRFNELLQLGACTYLGNRNAGEFMIFAKQQNLPTGQDPVIGACMVWTSSGDGHVAIVEEIVDNDHVITSESGWNYSVLPIVREVKRSRGTGNWGYSGTFQGFIYQPGSKPDPKPEPEPEQIYIVKRGDNLTKIAKMYGVTVADLVKWNNIKNSNLIITGQKLIIKAPAYEYYTVVRGDTLSGIAKKYNTTVNELLKLNSFIRNPNLILVGWQLRVK